jgi:hypothetical protein
VLEPPVLEPPVLELPEWELPELELPELERELLPEPADVLCWLCDEDAGDGAAAAPGSA